MVENIKTGIANIETTINNFEAALANKIQGVVENILALPQLLADKVKALFEEFFIPDEAATAQKLDSVRERFDFINKVSGFGEEIMDLMENASGKSAPVFTIDLSDYTGNFNWGSTVITIDFAWYGQFKPLIDNILAGIIWITWLWHMYKRIPELISGQGMTTAHSMDILNRTRDEE